MPGLPLDYLQQLQRQGTPSNDDDPVDAALRTIRAEDAHQTVVDNPSPDKVARVTKLARDTDTPPYQIDGNEDAVDTALRAKAVAGLAQRYPAIGHWAASNPRGVAAAQDDTKSLGKLGQAWDSLALTHSMFGLDPVHTMTRAQALAEADTNPGLARLAADRQLRQAQARGVFGQTMGSLRAGTAMAAGGVYGTAASVAGLVGASRVERGLLDVEAAAERYSDAQRGRSDSFIADSAYQGVESIPVAVGALLTGSERAGLALFASTQGGQSYAQARQQGVAPGSASLFGASQGALEAVFEAIPLHQLFQIGKGAGVPQAIKRFLISEVGGEEATTVLQNMNEWATLNPGKSFNQFLSEQPAQMAQTLIGTVVGAGPQIALAHAPQAAQQFVQRAAKADQAHAERQFFDKAAKAADESKFKARDPEGFRELVRHQAEEAGAQFAYVPSSSSRRFIQGGGEYR